MGIKLLRMFQKCPHAPKKNIAKNIFSENRFGPNVSWVHFVEVSGHFLKKISLKLVIFLYRY
jgi:hypothetical protein